MVKYENKYLTCRSNLRERHTPGVCWGRGRAPQTPLIRAKGARDTANKKRQIPIKGACLCVLCENPLTSQTFALDIPTELSFYPRETRQASLKPNVESKHALTENR